MALLRVPFFLVLFFFLAMAGNFLVVLSQHCASLDSGSLSHQDLCYPHWKQLAHENHGQALIYLQDSQTKAKDVLFFAKQQSEALKAVPKSCRNAAAALVCSGTLLGCDYAPLGEEGMITQAALLSVTDLSILSTEPAGWPGLVPLPRPPCKSVCEKMVQECSGVEGVELPNCDAIDSTTGSCRSITW